MVTKGARLIFSYLIVIQSGESRERKGETVQLNMVADTQHTALNRNCSRLNQTGLGNAEQQMEHLTSFTISASVYFKFNEYSKIIT